MSYRPVPDWVLRNDAVDELKAKVQEEMEEGALYCIAVDYEAPDLGVLIHIGPARNTGRFRSQQLNQPGSLIWPFGSPIPHNLVFVLSYTCQAQYRVGDP